MSFIIKNLDIIVIVAFLLGNLILGMFSGRGIKSLKEYAIGNRDFSTAAIAATIIATWVSGSFFVINVSETYKQGLWHVCAVTAGIIDLLIMGLIFAPRMKEFFGKLSVADVMGDLYGSKMRNITALASIAQAMGRTAIQVKVFATIFTYFFGVDNLYATIASSSIVIAYSSVGGIRSVTFTDMMQFFTFGVFIPILTLLVWSTFGSVEALSTSTAPGNVLNYDAFLNYKHPKFITYLFLFLSFSIPSLNSTMFQRMLMARDTNQIRRSFSIAAAVCGSITLLTCFIGIVIFTNNSNLDPTKVAMKALECKQIPGFIGLAVVSLLAMVMSTADSWINTGAVIFSHDICGRFSMSESNRLWIARIFSVFIGMSGIYMALVSTNLLQLSLLTSNFYVPIVTGPLMLAILGFRTSTKAVFVAITSGIVTVLAWRNYIQPVTGIDSVIPGLFANIITLFLAHYLLRAKGGWVGTKDASDLQDIRKERYERYAAFCRFLREFPVKIGSFSLRQYCLKHIPKNEASYVYFAIGVLFSTLVIGLTNHSALASYDGHIVFVLYLIALSSSTIFFCHSLWNEQIRQKYIGLIWYIAIFSSLAYTSCTFAILCHFSQIASVIFVLNLIMIGVLLNWWISIVMVIFGMLCAFVTYLLVGGSVEIAAHVTQDEIMIGFVLVMFTGFVTAFIKPTQDSLAIAEEKSQNLWEKIRDMDKEVHKAEFLKTEFLNNISHEVRTPMTGITSMGQVLYENYDRLSEAQRKECVRDIARSSDRLQSLMNNILDLSALTSLKLELHLNRVNLGELVRERVEHCKKMYLDGKKLKFELDIDEDSYVKCDLYHISHTIDNLIINAIAYSRLATIVKINVKNVAGSVEFSIRDEGVGIPQNELFDIFKPFTVSSKTKTPSGGRGVGLSLCFAVLANHGGKIWAESDGASWAEFKFKL